MPGTEATAKVLPMTLVPLALKRLTRHGVVLIWGLFATALAVALVALPLERAVQIVGNASFAATFLSFAQSDILKLRLLAIASLIMGLIYNTNIHLNMPQGQGIALVLFWLALFLTQNLYMAGRELAQSIEVPMAPDERLLASTAFPTMHSRDWQILASACTKRTLPFGASLLCAGGQTDSIMLLAYGQADEVRSDGLPTLERHAGTFWGELTWTLGKGAFNQSPCEVMVTSPSAEIWEWSYERLNRLTARNPRMLAALRDGFLRSACFKHGLLQVRRHDAKPIWDEELAIV